MELWKLFFCLVILFATVGQIHAADDAHDNSPGHDNSFFDESIFTPQLAYCSLLVLFCAILTAGAGIGGGVLFLPIYVIVLQLEPHFAVPLSKATIVGVSYGGYLVNCKRRHPLADRPLIDYDTALVMQPMLLIGSIIGVSLNVIFPKILITIFLIVLLTITCYRTIKKGYNLYQAESKPTIDSPKDNLQDPLLDVSSKEIILHRPSKSRRKESRGSHINMVSAESFSTKAGSPLTESLNDKTAAADESAFTNGDTSHVVSVPEKDQPHISQIKSLTSGDGIVDVSRECEEMLEEESRTPWAKFLRAIAILAGLIIIYVFKGGSSGSASVVGIECGTWQYWLVLSMAIPYLGGLTFLYGRYLVQRAEKKEEIDFPYVDGDIRWTKKLALYYPLFAGFAGICAGCLGIGGGLVLGPLLLEIGIYPPVVSATSAFTIIFTSTSITVQFLILQRLDYEQGTWYAIMGFIGAILGHLWVKALLKKYKKASLVSLVLGFAVGLSAVVIMVFSIDEAVTEGAQFDFHSICDPAAGA